MKTSKISRIDKGFEMKMKDIMKERYDKHLANLNIRELSVAEATRLVLRTPSWNQVEKELRTLPKKK